MQVSIDTGGHLAAYTPRRPVSQQQLLGRRGLVLLPQPAHPFACGPCPLSLMSAPALALVRLPSCWMVLLLVGA